MTNDVNDATSDSDDDIDEEDDEQKYQLTQWFPSDFSATDQVPTLLFTTYEQWGSEIRPLENWKHLKSRLIEGQIGFQLVRL